jgi:RNA polymerase sigma-70 factor (ECF subfamily)
LANEELHINPPELVEMIKACKAQHPLGQRKLFEHFYSYVKTICLRYSSRIEDCEEIMDDSFIKVFKGIDKYDFERPFKYWLRTIVVNTSIDFYRQSMRVVKSNPIEDYMNFGIDDHTISRMSCDEILKVVQKLSPAYRNVFMMFVMDGYSHKEIGTILKITEGTSKSNLAKARIKLQELLLKEFAGDPGLTFVNLSLPSNI